MYKVIITDTVAMLQNYINIHTSITNISERKILFGQRNLQLVTAPVVPDTNCHFSSPALTSTSSSCAAVIFVWWM